MQKIKNVLAQQRKAPKK